MTDLIKLSNHVMNLAMKAYITTPNQKQVLKVRQMQDVMLDKIVKLSSPKTIQQLDEIFWKKIAIMKSGKFFHEVNTVGGAEKADATRSVAEQVSIDLSNVMYVGDSITDVETFKLVKENEGLAISFNGNQYAIRNAEIAVLSENSTVTAIIADVFCRFGKQETLGLMEKWNHEELEKSPVSPALLNLLFDRYPKELPKVKIITNENMEVLAKESSEFRKKVRGEIIGRLG